uniref:TNFR-Cys domain-containing protein n=1 Tax=Globisporangium ultimum (strain ATCC 200006 / CBS 805.95 / DAOM BR144) TaxID=431595 RepID=K3X6B3_GLOUD
MRLLSFGIASSWFLAACLLVVPSGVTAADADEANLHIDQDCNTSVTPENAELGFGAVWDTTCLKQNLGCFEKVCRLCRKSDNDHTKFYTRCSDLPAKQLPTTSAPASASTRPSNAGHIKGALDQQEAAPAAATSAQCAAKVSQGDQGVGITAVSDPSCSSGGLGCFGNENCKYCRNRITPQSQHYSPCSASTSTSPAATSAASANTLPPVSCPTAVARSGLTSISYITEPSCQTNAHLTGCITSSTCRLCRTAKNENNQFLVSCKVLQDQQTTTVMTMAAAENIPITGANSNTSAAGQDETGAAMGGACAAAGVALVLAMFAIRKVRAKQKVVDGGDHLNRGSSLVQIIGRERIAEL